MTDYVPSAEVVEISNPQIVEVYQATDGAPSALLEVVEIPNSSRVLEVVEACKQGAPAAPQVEIVQDISTSGGVLTCDFTSGNVFRTLLTENATSLLMTNLAASGTYVPFTLEITQGGAGNFTIVWPASFKWPGGIVPVLSTVPGAVDLVTGYTMDGGLAWGITSTVLDSK